MVLDSIRKVFGPVSITISLHLEGVDYLVDQWPFGQGVAQPGRNCEGICRLIDANSGYVKVGGQTAALASQLIGGDRSDCGKSVECAELDSFDADFAQRGDGLFNHGGPTVIGQAGRQWSEGHVEKGWERWAGEQFAGIGFDGQEAEVFASRGGQVLAQLQQRCAAAKHVGNAVQTAGLQVESQPVGGYGERIVKGFVDNFLPSRRSGGCGSGSRE